MKINMIKQPGGVLVPASDREAELLTKFKTGGMYEIEIKQARNPEFLAKAFTFFEYCFEHWDSGQEFTDEKTQFEGFRKDLTILAGFYNTYYRLNGETRVEAKSLSFGSMSEDEFRRCYEALIQAAMKTIFTGDDAYDRLVGFF